MSASDIESLQPRASSGRRCLHAFLIISVITQFVLLSGVTVIAALFIRQIQTELATLTKPTHKSPEAILHPRMGNSGYKVQNFAYLRPESGSLKNDMVKWRAESPESVGSGYKLSDTLQPNKEGSYLIYLDLVLRCVRNDTQLCGSTNIMVRVGDGVQNRTLLECRVTSQGRGGAAKCWQVVRLERHRGLVAKMEAHNAANNWELDTEQSGMGMFLVDWQNR